MEKRIYNIAIVDDESEILNMLERFLKRNEKYSITTYSNPIVAIDNIDNSCDIILMDIMMPQMNGLEALEKIIEKRPEQKVIMMTAYSTLGKVLSSHKYGAIEYLLKPFASLKSVEKKISEFLTL